MSVQRRSLGWLIGTSGTWYAQSFKWFVLLLIVLPTQVGAIVPDSKNAAYGSMSAIGAAWATFGPFLFSWLSYRIPAKWGRHRSFLIWGMVGTVGALLLLMNAKSMLVMTIGYLALQMSDDLSTGPYAGLLPERVEEKQRGQASGILGMARFLGQITGAIGGALLSKNLVGAYLGIATVTIVFNLITLATLGQEPAYRPEEGRKPNVGQLFSEFAAPWKDRDFVLVFAITWIGNLGYFMIQTFVQNFFKDRMTSYEVFGSTVDIGVFKVTDAATAVSFLALVISFVGILGSLASTKLVDQWGRKRCITIGGGLMAGALIPFAIFHVFMIGIIIAPIFAVGMGLYTSASWALISDVLKDENGYGKDMGIWQAATSSVQIGSGLMGFMVDGFNKQGNGLGYTTMFLTGASLIVVASTLVWRVKGSS